MPAKGQSDWDPGCVYIARSRDFRHGVYKIGLSRNPKKRRKDLNRGRYHDSNKWFIAHVKAVSCMRCVEEQVQKALGEPFKFYEGAREIELREAPYPKVKNTLNKIAKRYKSSFPRQLWQWIWR